MTTAIPLHPLTARTMIEPAATANKNFGLDETAFAQLLDQLEAGDERLFERVFVRQFRRLVRMLQSAHSAQTADAEDSVMNALLDFRRLLVARKVNYGNLEAYLHRVVVTGHQRRLRRSREVATADFPDGMMGNEAAPDFTAEHLAAFSKAWATLCEKCSGVLKGFYYDELPHQRIAEMLGKRTDAVKQDKHRCVEKLRRAFFQNLQDQ